MIEPHGVTDDLSWETMTFVERIHPAIFSRSQQVDSTVAGAEVFGEAAFQSIVLVSPLARAFPVWPF